MKSFLIAVAGLAVVAAPLAASAQSYGHDRGGYGHGDYGRGDYGRGDYGRGDYGRGDYRRDYDRDGGGAALAAGVAGLFIGSTLAGSGDRYDDDYRPAYGYAQPYPYESYGYARRCYVQTRPYYTPYGEVAYRRVRVCR